MGPAGEYGGIKGQREELRVGWKLGTRPKGMGNWPGLDGEGMKPILNFRWSIVDPGQMKSTGMAGKGVSRHAHPQAR